MMRRFLQSVLLGCVFLDKFVIEGGKRLCGEVEISGAKNAAVAILPATLLAGDKCTVENIPDIEDVRIMLHILEEMGAKVTKLDRTSYEIDTRNVSCTTVPASAASRLRASYYFIGSLLGRFGEATVAMPGGCDLGARPIDLHIKGFEALNGKVSLSENEDVVSVVKGNGGLLGSSVYFDVVSVGATINVMLTAVMAEGLTIIEQAAREPHIVDIANFLNLCGADVRGAGTDTIKIRGVKRMHGCSYSIIPDQIEAGTYMLAAAATNGNVLIKNVTPKHLDSITAKLLECGVFVENFADSVRVTGRGKPHKCNIKTSPHPGFPTDMQPQFAVLLSVADGDSTISESVWDNRFRYVEQLNHMGAQIKVVGGKSAVISGVSGLSGSKVRADDLRAGAAMIIAGLIAEGTTEIKDIYHIDRGYEKIVEKFSSLGAVIKRVPMES